MWLEMGLSRIPAINMKSRFTDMFPVERFFVFIIDLTTWKSDPMPHDPMPHALQELPAVTGSDQGRRNRGAEDRREPGGIAERDQGEDVRGVNIV